MTNIEKLTKLQKDLGYQPGPASIIALLGLMGEVGEVAAEANIVFDPDSDISVEGVNIHLDIKSQKNQYLLSAYELDKAKKKLRKDLSFLLKVEVMKDDDFNLELADVFYYLNILATNRGLTIEDLARLSHDKVRAKMDSRPEKQ